MLIILLLMFTKLMSAADDAVFTEYDKRGYFLPDRGYKCFLAGTHVQVGGILEKLRGYFKEHVNEGKIELLIVWEDGELYKVGSLKGRYISNRDIRILLHVAKKDPESESGHALISDVCCNTFVLHGLSFAYGATNDSELFDLSKRIRTADYNDFLEFKEGL